MALRLPSERHYECGKRVSLEERKLGSDSADVLAEILRTTLHLVEQRRDLDQNAPSVSKLKESMRRTIAEVEQHKKPQKAEVPENEERPTWSDVLRKKSSS
jgi:hypothetical protein